MLDQADASLYAAKRNGRNQVVCFDRMPTEITERARSDRRKTFTPEGKNTVDKLDVIPFEAVSALLSALSFRDVATAEHSHRVADLCVKVGEKLLSKAECYRLEVAALLHDIGKVGVPDAILRKSGELNADEWQLMDQHEQMGVEIVRKAFASQQLAEIIQNYRAWFNGCSRNPALPAGNAIPMEARILAIADAWDSMTTSRPWRPGRTFESAAVELKRCAGSQFDTECVEHFLRILRETSASQPATEMSADARSINEDLAEITTSLEAQNFERIATITDHLRSAANRLGAKNVTAQADRLRSAVMSDADLLSILHITRELTTECRQLQQSAPTAKRPTAE
jgi:putative nucleotidyltransferase with HDIG domain